MALGSRQYTFEVDVSDVDRGVYDTVTLRVACHPSETEVFLVTRVLAYALELCEGVAFSQGLESADDPAVWVKDLTGRLKTWIDIGTPDPARLHKASKTADRVVVYCHKLPEAWLKNVEAAHIHDADALEIVVLDRAFIAELAGTVERRNAWSLSVTEGVVYLDVGATSLTTTLERRQLDA